MKDHPGKVIRRCFSKKNGRARKFAPLLSLSLICPEKRADDAMLKMIRVLLTEINLKTIYFNFHYFPLRQAIKLPVFVSKRVFLLKTKGKIVLEGPVKPRMVRLGYRNVGIFDHQKSRSIWEVEGTVSFGGKVNIGHGSKLSVGDGASLRIGQGTIISAESTIAARMKHVEIGQNCLLSWDILIMDTDFHRIYQNDMLLNEPEDVKIGNNVWIGCRCLILKGAGISDGSVIAANSVVNKRLEGQGRLFGGQPARELKDNIRWEM